MRLNPIGMWFNGSRNLVFFILGFCTCKHGDLEFFKGFKLVYLNICIGCNDLHFLMFGLSKNKFDIHDHALKCSLLLRAPSHWASGLGGRAAQSSYDFHTNFNYSNVDYLTPISLSAFSHGRSWSNEFTCGWAEARSLSQFSYLNSMMESSCATRAAAAKHRHIHTWRVKK